MLLSGIELRSETRRTVRALVISCLRGFRVEEGDGVHLDPRRLIEVVDDEANLGQLAHDAGLEPRVLREAWLAERRLDRPALQRLAEALHLSVEVLACLGREFEGDDSRSAVPCL